MSVAGRVYLLHEAGLVKDSSKEYVGAEFCGAGQTSEFTLDCLGQRRACLGDALEFQNATLRRSRQRC